MRLTAGIIIVAFMLAAIAASHKAQPVAVIDDVTVSKVDYPLCVMVPQPPLIREREGNYSYRPGAKRAAGVS